MGDKTKSLSKYQIIQFLKLRTSFSPRRPNNQKKQKKKQLSSKFSNTKKKKMNLLMLFVAFSNAFSVMEPEMEDVDSLSDLSVSFDDFPSHIRRNLQRRQKAEIRRFTKQRMASFYPFQ